jgi:hypothetical protein
VVITFTNCRDSYMSTYSSMTRCVCVYINQLTSTWLQSRAFSFQLGGPREMYVRINSVAEQRLAKRQHYRYMCIRPPGVNQLVNYAIN